MNKSNPKQIEGQALFLKELTKYFMEFLETNFHKRRQPKRSIKLTNSMNLKTGIILDIYEKYTVKLKKHFYTNLTSKIVLDISPNTFQSDIATTLQSIFITELRTNYSDSIDKLLNEFLKAFKKELHTEFNSSPLEVAQDLFRSKSKKIIINPLSDRILSGFKNKANTLFLPNLFNTKEILDAFCEECRESITQVLPLVNSSEEKYVILKLKENINDACLKSVLTEYKKNVIPEDLYKDAYELLSNLKILENHDIYFYFFDIQYGNEKFPIFYIPLSLELDDNKISLSFEPHCYINTKALSYITQQYSKDIKQKPEFRTYADRKIFLNAPDVKIDAISKRLLDDLLHHFEFDENIDHGNFSRQVIKDEHITLTNTAYLALFDKSDESIINDYEGILQLLEDENDTVYKIFQKTIEDFIYREPNILNSEIDNSWDEHTIDEKLVYSSPVPLNEEQRKIIEALYNEQCKYITVEGPPGTGKSHTITAIIFEAIKNHQSILILSDKDEALDVVESKIEDVLNSTRTSDKVNNPILRLGKKFSSYSKILSTQSISQINEHYKVTKGNINNIEQAINSISNSLQNNIKNLDISSSQDDIENSLLDFIHDSEELSFDDIPLNNTEIEQNIFSSDFLDKLYNISREVKDRLNHRDSKQIRSVFKSFDIDTNNNLSLGIISALISILKEFGHAKSSVDNSTIQILKDLRFMDDIKVETVKRCNDSLRKIKKPLVGFLFNRKKMNEIINTLNNTFKTEHFDDICRKLDDLTAIVEGYNILKDNYEKLDLSAIEVMTKLKFCDYYEYLLFLDIDSAVNVLMFLISKINEIIEVGCENYTESLILNNIELDNISSWATSTIVNYKKAEIDEFSRYINSYHSIKKLWTDMPDFDFASLKKQLEILNSYKMTHMLDERLIEFINNYKATASNFRDIIRKKKRFPKNDFGILKDAFPCILASIRDFAEFIPMEPNMFDILIIDEASQVSIAQAFPSLIRAKKVLIFGDRKQFSNIKASLAKSLTNVQYLNSLRKIFKENISDDPTKLERFEKFNIRVSILEFFEFIANYHTQLLKHFRGYKELISFSNNNFYNNTLQVMKIRGIPINETIKISILENELNTSRENIDIIANTNINEIEYIITDLLHLKGAKRPPTVGIITPHTNQQKLISYHILKHQDRDFFFDDLKLKIMTFDTCQGEERDKIYFSMVADEVKDKLWAIFPKDIIKARNDIEDNIRSQRLNVGFSRSKEQLHFILSKHPSKFNGAIASAINHYKKLMEDVDEASLYHKVDPNSPMEKLVLNWLFQTTIYMEKKDNIEIIPQFEIGAYIKQLDPNYNQPLFKVDFLLLYVDKESRKNHKIIIEYDGFLEHFTDHESVDDYNFNLFYSTEDNYRQKVIEAYGYRFIRLNKFNIGTDPISTINAKLEEIINADFLENWTIKKLDKSITGLIDGTMKECEKCLRILHKRNFYDRNLINKYGRSCKNCKKKKAQSRKSTNRNKLIDYNKCPKCGARMVLRNGKYGEFYGCTQYPDCRGTRNV